MDLDRERLYKSLGGDQGTWTTRQLNQHCIYPCSWAGKSTTTWLVTIVAVTENKFKIWIHIYGIVEFPVLGNGCRSVIKEYGLMKKTK